MRELMRLIAAEALYQHARQMSMRSRILISREQFAAGNHQVALSVDGLLWLALGGFLVIPVGMTTSN